MGSGAGMSIPRVPQPAVFRGNFDQPQPLSPLQLAPSQPVVAMPLWSPFFCRWMGVSQFNKQKALQTGATRFKAHFKKENERVRVAMNPIALYMDSLPCPQAFLGSGAVYSADDSMCVQWDCARACSRAGKGRVGKSAQ